MSNLDGVILRLCCSLKFFMYATMSSIALYELIPPKFKSTLVSINQSVVSNTTPLNLINKLQTARSSYKPVQLHSNTLTSICRVQVMQTQELLQQNAYLFETWI